MAEITVVFNETDTWECPAGVSTVNVQCWGGGGKGGPAGGPNGGGGGGGGAYASEDIAVTPTTIYDVIVGLGSTSGASPGGDSYFDDGSEVLAKGGNSAPGQANATGGDSASCIGTTKFSGGDGATGVGGGGPGGGGGGVAFDNADGGDATGSTGGSGYGDGAEGDGGNGATSGGSDGSPGNLSGGGGGGGHSDVPTTFGAGGNGADGLVVLTYEEPVPSFVPSFRGIMMGVGRGVMGQR